MAIWLRSAVSGAVFATKMIGGIVGIMAAGIAVVFFVLWRLPQPSPNPADYALLARYVFSMWFVIALINAICTHSDLRKQPS